MKYVGKIVVNVDEHEYELAVVEDGGKYYYSIYGWGVNEAEKVESKLAEEGKLDHDFLSGPFATIEDLVEAARQEQDADEITFIGE